MAEQRFVSVQYCDDVRPELGNKVSLMGCYGPSMLLTSFPAVLPKLCAHVKVYAPTDRPFAKLAIRIFRGDQILMDLKVPPEALANALSAERPLDAKWQIAGSLLTMSPFPVEEPCELRVEIETEDGTISGGTFRIESAPKLQ